MRLYGSDNQRLYLNASERMRFVEAAEQQPAHIRAFCLTLLYTGCRISEARELTIQSLQGREQRIAIRSLKKRNQHHVREVPIPVPLCQSLSQLAARAKTTSALVKPEHITQIQNNDGSSMQAENASIPSPPWLWQNSAGDMIDRIIAYRWVKNVMEEADIYGPQACPKGLRHGFGIHAVLSGVPLNMLQKWMGHADIRTTSIYANAVGPEELRIAERMWT